ncbi:MAG: NAD(P)-dependent oxidoreductase [Planctomycetota bacterium]|nr:NAD(P)-dependent oxidoreductase [Planctomycetota bacterium]
MKILLTGASSFTGFWFLKELAAAGHQVIATFRKPPAQYPDEPRRTRAALAQSLCTPVIGPSFGDPAFLDLIKSIAPLDLLAHHAADVTNYKSTDFNTLAALQNNTLNIATTLATLKSAGCNKILLTGSVFESNEGAGSESLPAFSPYGLSKELTCHVFRYHARSAELALAKFVIPNPFGPYEEPRFTGFLIKNWFADTTPAVSTPAYVRDNIHVSLLAKAYAHFASTIPSAPCFTKLNPSGYAESQGAFTLRFAAEMRPRLHLPCPVELKKQTDFAEPRVRINTDIPDTQSLGWDESAAWDDIANYYKQVYKK